MFVSVTFDETQKSGLLGVADATAVMVELVSSPSLPYAMSQYGWRLQYSSATTGGSGSANNRQ